MKKVAQSPPATWITITHDQHRTGIVEADETLSHVRLTDLYGMPVRVPVEAYGSYHIQNVNAYISRLIGAAEAAIP